MLLVFQIDSVTSIKKFFREYFEIKYDFTLAEY
jgi:hypothetical protein